MTDRRISPLPGIAQLQSHSLADLVQTEIERFILDGVLAPGAKLTEATLADLLGVSRGPVREAFRMLEEAGLVRTEKNRGVFVRDVSVEEALEIFEVRAVMDLYVGRKLAETATPAQVKALRQMVDAMNRAARAGEAADFHRTNLAFHDRLLELAGNAKLVATYRKLVKELSLYRRRNLNGESMAVYAREHKQIVRAIASGDPEAAGQAMFQHVMNSRARTLEASRRAAGGAAAGAPGRAGARRPVRGTAAGAAAP
ncbi:phosphonate utilization associated transcriptional regulator [Paracidovorax avenae]|uniref:phosphonate utilization associated transcriptional regulator n=1 Tax=Paracidovorax avenae TaxID=80867 RepID=UPI000D20C326|nr:phosphonate utilization associated transcriptional regulator [Paracidovorax avenae]AVS93276.1 phosphonate utilization associated transcriptional regulator [Paracidovorax avenae]AVS96985.1 phosphonate utilization associated transcriptional regulator [Paracidovorax avenae]AVT11007.1 phosphonate utilization associated transcriptional regulator [Paracidovorax avenae]